MTFRFAILFVLNYSSLLIQVGFLDWIQLLYSKIMSEAAKSTYYFVNTAILRDAKMKFYEARSSENKVHQIQDYSNGI